MDYRYRIKANVGADQVLKVNLKQDIDIYEILSLTLNQTNLYKLHSADYGIIVGRVLANDAFGVPNVKVSVFIPLSDVDELRQDIRSIYPYKFVTDTDSNNVRFNTLPNYKISDCHRAIGSFPKKQLVLDDDSVLELYDKYYKYTTVTNNAGDYMIFGVPTGEQILHVDVDLSDIGILSQTPRDMMYKGYSADLFESPTQFKKSTNLDDLAQIQSQTATVTVYPLWGDKTTNEVAISRKDITLQYKFEPTCVFMGAVMTDNSPNSIGYNCIPDENVGEASQLTPSKGNIEMIRKTIDDGVEEYNIKGNQLIDGDGTWCYQIPMNLDYLGMDERGNIVQTENPDKGIPTRTRVRFRISLDETSDDSLTMHKARYLVPNNPELYHGYTIPRIHKDKLDDNGTYYEFGSMTPNECFRDLYWNKVYSVKNYIPRLQTSKHENASNYLAIKGVNKNNAKKHNPIPFNKLNLNITLSAYQILRSIFADSNDDKRRENQIGIGLFWRYLRSYSVLYNTDAVRDKILEEMDGIGLDFYNDWLNGCLYFPSWYWQIKEKSKKKNGKSAYESTFCECKGQNINSLYIYNNCSLVYKNSDLVLQKSTDLKPGACSATSEIHEFYDFYKYYIIDKYKPKRFSMYTSLSFGSKEFYSGVIKKKTTKTGSDVFYYSFGNKLDGTLYSGNSEYDSKIDFNLVTDDIITGGNVYCNYARLFSTDIILLGSLSDNDIDGVPKIGFDIPSTTANIPPMGRYKRNDSETAGEDEDDVFSDTGPRYSGANYTEEDMIGHNGMNWGNFLDKKSPFSYEEGLFFGVEQRNIYYGYRWPMALSFFLTGSYIFHNLFGRIIAPVSDVKTCVNAERICELGVTFDENKRVMLDYKSASEDDGTTYHSEYTERMDGFITNREINDYNSRSLFATLNYNKLNGLKTNEFTGYKKYYLPPLYPLNFDGRLENVSICYSSGHTQDYRNKDYLDFRFGSNDLYVIENEKPLNTSNTQGHRYGGRRSGSNSSSDNEYVHKQSAYTVYDGYISVKKQIIPRTRHFYGYNSQVDDVYPFTPENKAGVLWDGHTKKIPAISTDRPYSFPLYENSFYFYFGLNQGSTAIDKFYEKFYSPCPREEKDPFILLISTKAATACSVSAGTIDATVQNAEFPYSYKLEGPNRTIQGRSYFETTPFRDLTNGNYKLTITDNNGSTMYETIKLMYGKIELSYETTDIELSSSGTVTNQGHIIINSYTLYGEKHDVTSFNYSSDNEEYKINDKVAFKIAFDKTSEEFNPFCDTMFSGNKFNICKPSNFSITVYEKCNGQISDNTSNYAVSVVNAPDSLQSENGEQENSN